MIIIDAETLGATWLECLKKVMDYGKLIIDENENLQEICNLSIRIGSISQDDSIILKYADAKRIELMHKKYESIEVIEPFNVSYGKCLYCNQGIDQIGKIVQRLKEKPETKSATISLHTPQDKKPTCLSLIDCKIRHDKLNITAVYRSQNLYGSQPGNILALSKIFKKIASALNITTGFFYLYIISAHIYAKDFNKVKNILEHITKG